MGSAANGSSSGSSRNNVMICTCPACRYIKHVNFCLSSFSNSSLYTSPLEKPLSRWPSQRIVDMADSKRRSARVLADRKRSIYYDPGSDDDFDEVEGDEEQEYQPERQPSAGPSQQRREPAVQRPRKKRKVSTFRSKTLLGWTISRNMI